MPTNADNLASRLKERASQSASAAKMQIFWEQSFARPALLMFVAVLVGMTIFLSFALANDFLSGGTIVGTLIMAGISWFTLVRFAVLGAGARARSRQQERLGSEWSERCGPCPILARGLHLPAERSARAGVLGVVEGKLVFVPIPFGSFVWKSLETWESPVTRVEQQAPMGWWQWAWYGFGPLELSFEDRTSLRFFAYGGEEVAKALRAQIGTSSA